MRRRGGKGERRKKRDRVGKLKEQEGKKRDRRRCKTMRKVGRAGRQVEGKEEGEGEKVEQGYEIKEKEVEEEENKSNGERKKRRVEGAVGGGR